MSASAQMPSRQYATYSSAEMSSSAASGQGRTAATRLDDAIAQLRGLKYNAGSGSPATDKSMSPGAVSSPGNQNGAQTVTYRTVTTRSVGGSNNSLNSPLSAGKKPSIPAELRRPSLNSPVNTSTPTAQTKLSSSSSSHSSAGIMHSSDSKATVQFDSKGKCTCCPFGYHVDVDFANFSQDVNNGSGYVPQQHIPRRHRSSVDGSMSPASHNGINVRSFDQQTSGSLFLDDLSSPSAQMNQRQTTPVQRMMVRSQSASAPYTTVTTTEETYRVPSAPLSPSGSTDSSSYSNHVTKTRRTVTSHQLAETMAAHLPDSGGNEALTISPESVQQIKQHIAMSLERMKELEEQIKVIPTMQDRISRLKEEKRMIALQLQAKNKMSQMRSIGVGDYDIEEEPETRVEKVIQKVIQEAARAPTREVGVGVYDVNVEFITAAEAYHTIAENVQRIKEKEIQTWIQEAEENLRMKRAAMRSMGVGDGNVFEEEEKVAIKEKETRTIYLEPEKPEQRNVGLQVKPSMRDVCIEFSQHEDKPLTRTVGFNVDVPDLMQELATQQQEVERTEYGEVQQAGALNQKNAWTTQKHVIQRKFMEAMTTGRKEDLVLFITNLLRRSVRSIGTTVKPTTADFGQRTAMSACDRGVGDDTVNVIVKPWVMTRDNIAMAKPTTKTQPTWTDLILTCDAGSNTQVPTAVKAVNTLPPPEYKTVVEKQHVSTTLAVKPPLEYTISKEVVETRDCASNTAAVSAKPLNYVEPIYKTEIGTYWRTPPEPQQRMHQVQKPYYVPTFKTEIGVYCRPNAVKEQRKMPTLSKPCDHTVRSELATYWGSIRRLTAERPSFAWCDTNTNLPTITTSLATYCRPNLSTQESFKPSYQGQVVSEEKSLRAQTQKKVDGKSSQSTFKETHSTKGSPSGTQTTTKTVTVTSQGRGGGGATDMAAMMGTGNSSSAQSSSMTYGSRFDKVIAPDMQVHVDIPMPAEVTGTLKEERRIQSTQEQKPSSLIEQKTEISEDGAVSEVIHEVKSAPGVHKEKTVKVTKKDGGEGNNERMETVTETTETRTVSSSGYEGSVLGSDFGRHKAEMQMLLSGQSQPPLSPLSVTVQPQSSSSSEVITSSTSKISASPHLMSPSMTISPRGVKIEREGQAARQYEAELRKQSLSPLSSNTRHVTSEETDTGSYKEVREEKSTGDGSSKEVVIERTFSSQGGGGRFKSGLSDFDYFGKGFGGKPPKSQSQRMERYGGTTSYSTTSTVDEERNKTEMSGDPLKSKYNIEDMSSPTSFKDRLGGSSASSTVSTVITQRSSSSSGGDNSEDGIRSIIKKGSRTGRKSGIKFAEHEEVQEVEVPMSDDDQVDVNRTGQDESESEESDSFEEASYDRQQGEVSYEYEEQQLSQAKSQEEIEMNVELEAACSIVQQHLESGSNQLPSKVTSALSVIQQDWFKVSSASNTNHREVAEYLTCFTDFSMELLEHIVNMVDGNGNTALHYAVSHCNFKVVRLIVESGVADVNLQNKAGYTPIMLAALAEVTTSEDRKAIRLLLSKGNVNLAASQAGQTALMLAVSHGRYEMVQLLLEAGADINMQDEDGSTALMCATEHGHVDIVKCLLNDPNVDINLKDNDGSTALEIALENQKKEIGVLLYAKDQQMKANSTTSIKKRQTRIPSTGGRSSRTTTTRVVTSRRY